MMKDDSQSVIYVHVILTFVTCSQVPVQRRGVQSAPVYVGRDITRYRPDVKSDSLANVI